MAKASGICWPSEKPFALATDQLLVAIALAPAAATALALPASQMLKRQERLSGNVQRPEVFRLTRLIGHSYRGQCHGATCLAVSGATCQ